MKNLLVNIPTDLPEELFETLIKTDNIHIDTHLSPKATPPPKKAGTDQVLTEQNLLLDMDLVTQFRIYYFWGAYVMIFELKYVD